MNLQNKNIQVETFRVHIVNKENEIKILHKNLVTRNEHLRVDKTVDE